MMNDEALRCLLCKKPKCALQGCPVHTPVPECMLLYRQGKLDEAGANAQIDARADQKDQHNGTPGKAVYFSNDVCECHSFSSFPCFLSHMPPAEPAGQ